jgi:alpha-1,3-rhamnosyl/mannosyltransferase
MPANHPSTMRFHGLVDVARRSYRIARTGFPLAWPTPRRIAATWRWGRRLAADIRRRRAEDGLTVAVDISPLFESLTGVGWYLHEVLCELADRPGLRLRLYGPTMFAGPDGPHPAAALPAGRAVEGVRHEVSDALLVRPSWLTPLMRLVEPRLVAADGNQVVFAPNFFPPRPLAAARGPLVATVQDMTLYRTPWAMRAETRADLERRLERTIARAHTVLTPSETVRTDLVERFGAPPGAVHAVHDAGRLGRVSPGELPAEVPARFVLHVGTIEPRKNVATLLAAWPRLRAALPDAPPLVLCGKTGWGSEAIEGELTRAAAEGWLLRLGYTPDPALRALYDRAAAVVSPSLYEGFGLPLVEAMAAGAPLVCSDIPVFREVAADAAVFVPPGDADAWARALAEVLSDAGRARDLEARGAARARAFSWRNTADRTLAVWTEAAGSSRAGAAGRLGGVCPDDS